MSFWRVRRLTLSVLPPQKLSKKGGKTESGERRRKSLLPWHRKDRSKSKDRGEADYKRKKRQRDREETGSVRSDLSGSRSSLASADLANLQRNAVSREVRLGMGEGDDRETRNGRGRQ